MIIKTDHVVPMNITQIIDSNIAQPKPFFFSLVLSKYIEMDWSGPLWIELEWIGPNWTTMDQMSNRN